MTTLGKSHLIFSVAVGIFGKFDLVHAKQNIGPAHPNFSGDNFILYHCMQALFHS
jgi:hypothetical protein